MSSEKSVVILPPPPKPICPVCGKPSYSLGGVHPQCELFNKPMNPGWAGFEPPKPPNQKRRSPLVRVGKNNALHVALNLT